MSKVQEVIDAMHKIISQNQQIYWICPLIEESETLDLTPVTKRFEFLKKVFQNDVGFMHGKQSSDEQAASMHDFQTGKIKILIATTVVEIGVDVPQATVMVIEHAQRFGLSQLHQLRGRIGRGSAKSYCILLYDGDLTEIAKKRLAIIRNCDDGFKIAEMDLLIRGTGEVFGTKQSGALAMKMLRHLSIRADNSDFAIYSELLTLAMKTAQSIVQRGKEEKYINLCKIYSSDPEQPASYDLIQ
jgi:ATP-dependent DNA helicase RecG